MKCLVTEHQIYRAIGQWDARGAAQDKIDRKMAGANLHLGCPQHLWIDIQTDEATGRESLPQEPERPSPASADIQHHIIGRLRVGNQPLQIVEGPLQHMLCPSARAEKPNTE